MKKILTAVCALALVCSFSFAQSNKEEVRAHKSEVKMAKSELNEKAGKAARKEARRLAKEGWVVSPGQLPLEKQLDRAYIMQYELDDYGSSKYYTGHAQVVGSAYDAARMQALNDAKTDLAGKIETSVTALTDGTLGNDQKSRDDAASISKAVQASKSLIANKLGRIVVMTECYREVGKKNVEVSIDIAYNTKMAMEAAKEVVKMKLEEEGKDLHEQLDKIWAEYK